MIPMDEALVDTLRERARWLKRDGFVFGEGSGFQRPFSGFSKAFARLWTTMPAETKRWTPHDLRRTVATRLAPVRGRRTGDRGSARASDRRPRRHRQSVYNAATTLDRQRRKRCRAGVRRLLRSRARAIPDGRS